MPVNPCHCPVVGCLGNFMARKGSVLIWFFMFLLFETNAANNLPVPQFEQYKVNRIYKGKPAVPILRTPQDREYRTRIREGAKQGPNFAGHYTVIILGCGTECSSFVIVDAAAGRVFSRAQKEYTCGPTFKLESRLLETDVCTGAIGKNCTRAFWEWTGTELKFLTRTPIECP